MSLSSAANIAQSGLSVVSAQTQVLTRNIADANTPGTSTKIANVANVPGSGSELISVTRVQNQSLFDNVLDATSSSATQTVISAGLDQLQATVGATSDGSDAQAPSTLLSSFTNALQSYEASPSNATLADAAVTAARSLTYSLNSATTIVQGVRETADADMASSVAQINTLLQQFQAVNSQIMAGTATGSDVTDQLDSRDSILTKLAQQIGITTVNGPNNSMNIYTDGGVTLFQGGVARAVTFTPTTSYTTSTTGNAVYVDGVPITGGASTMPSQSGNLVGYANLRDSVAVTYQAQLDSIAGNLISAFAESDQSGGGADQPGLFTAPGLTTTPASTTGLAGTIQVNASVDPNQGGNAFLLRDGGISDTTDTNYTYNTSGDASYNGRLEQLLSNLSSPMSFDPAGNIGTSDTLSDYSTASVSWLQGQRSTVASETTYQSTLLSQATTALSNTTGVSIDAQMSQMLNLENSYQASAKIMSTINSMYASLMQTMGITG